MRRKLTKNIDLTVKNTDFWLMFITLILIFIGVIAVFSASYYYALSRFHNPYHFLIRDIFYAVSGIAIMVLLSRINYNIYKKLSIPFMLIVLAMLILLFVPGLGQTVNGATRWLNLGVTIMPGEWAKLASIILASSLLAGGKDRIKDWRYILAVIGVAIVLFLLIFKQPNLSTAATVVIITGVIMFVAGLDLRIIGAVAATGAVGIAASILYQNDYKLGRIVSFLDPFKDVQGDSYQVVQGLYAMGSGGLFGAGPGKSIQKTLYLPEPQNDFILAIIGEEAGFIGVLVLMILFLLLIWRCIKVAVNAPDMFGMLLAAGISAMIGVQVLLNIGIVTSTFPPTGVTLPFISYGGNALWMFCASIGILLNISYRSDKQGDST